MIATIRKLFASRKALVALATAVVDVAAMLAPWIDEATKTALVTALTALAGAYLLAQGMADHGAGGSANSPPTYP